MTAPTTIARAIGEQNLDLAALIRPGDMVVCGQGTAEPRTVTERLVAEKDRIGAFEVFIGAAFSDTFAPDRDEGIMFTGFGAIGRTSELARAGRLNIIPYHYSSLSNAFHEGKIRADVVLLQLAAPIDGRGYSLSLANDYTAIAARHARCVIAEVNPHAPWTFGAELSDLVRLDVIVDAKYPPLELAASSLGENDQGIASHVAELIPERATLQIGVGSIPDAVLTGLQHHRDMGIHSGAISDRVVDLIESGVVTNAYKGRDLGVTVGGILLGSARLNTFAHDNATIKVCPPSYTHNYRILSELPRFCAVNSAIEVDLAGAVNAETANGTYFGAVGGQLDFIRAANASPAGRAIIALPSTARKGTVSRIVPHLRTVTTPRSDADVIVTEWGVAELRGQSLLERARRMISIAAPQFREELARAARSSYS